VKRREEDATKLFSYGRPPHFVIVTHNFLEQLEHKRKKKKKEH